MKDMTIPIQKLHENFILPQYAHEGDAGLDLYNVEAFSLLPGEYKKINCGFSIAIPSGYLGAIAPRSGLAMQSGVTVLNAWGVIDSTYRGEVAVILVNISNEVRTFPIKSRIAQLIIMPYQNIVFTLAETNLEYSDRGKNGFGSTGF